MRLNAAYERDRAETGVAVVVLLYLLVCAAKSDSFTSQQQVTSPRGDEPANFMD